MSGDLIMDKIVQVKQTYDDKFNATKDQLTNNETLNYTLQEQVNFLKDEIETMKKIAFLSFPKEYIKVKTYEKTLVKYLF